jgi:hypothetical protein
MQRKSLFSFASPGFPENRCVSLDVSSFLRLCFARAWQLALSVSPRQTSLVRDRKQSIWKRTRLIRALFVQSPPRIKAGKRLDMRQLTFPKQCHYSGCRKQKLNKYKYIIIGSMSTVQKGVKHISATSNYVSLRIRHFPLVPTSLLVRFRFLV